jgi:ribosomal protein L21E
MIKFEEVSGVLLAGTWIDIQLGSYRLGVHGHNATGVEKREIEFIELGGTEINAMSSAIQAVRRGSMGLIPLPGTKTSESVERVRTFSGRTGTVVERTDDAVKVAIDGAAEWLANEMVTTIQVDVPGN